MSISLNNNSNKPEWLSKFEDVLSVSIDPEPASSTIEQLNRLFVSSKNLEYIKNRFVQSLLINELELNNRGALADRDAILDRYSKNDPVIAARSYIGAKMKHDRVYTVDKIMDAWKVNTSRLTGHVSMVASYDIERKSWQDSLKWEKHLWEGVANRLISYFASSSL